MSTQKIWDVIAWDTAKGKVKVYLFDNNQEVRNFTQQLLPSTVTKYQVRFKTTKDTIPPAGDDEAR